MTNGWDGADPVQQNEPGVDYELATRFVAETDIAVTAIRVWSGVGLSENVVGRTGRLWSTGGVVLASVAMDATLSGGWTTYELAEPELIAEGTTFDVSYPTLRYYGAISGGYPNPSSDAAVTATQGRFHATPGSHPNTNTGSFYGIDIVYELAGNLPPEITSMVAVADELVVDATVTITDESPGSVAVQWDWGDGDTTTTGAGVVTAQHTYDAAGLYAVLAVATDDGALRDWRAVPVVVRGPAEGLDIDAAVAELAERLRTIPGLRVDKYGPEQRQVNPPHAIVTLPTGDIEYSQTYDAGGAMTATALHVVVLLGKQHSRSAYEALASYVSVPGPNSIKTVVESGVYVHLDDPMVTVAGFEEYKVAGSDYLAAVLDVHIAG